MFITIAVLPLFLAGVVIILGIVAVIAITTGRLP
jgi:hypothetical protein